MKQILLIFALCMTLTGCDNSCCEQQKYTLEGFWVLRQALTPDGRIFDYSDENLHTLMYVGDSLLYQGRMTRSAEAITFSPSGKSSVTLIDVGGGNVIYMEDDGEHPLTVEDDSTIIIQRMGMRYTWRLEAGVYEEWGKEMQRIAESELDSNSNVSHYYVLSSKERSQASVIHLFTYATIVIFVIFCVILHVALVNRREKRRLQLQLRQIQEEHDDRPQSVRQALESVETDYFGSDDYRTLLHRITSGQRLKEEDWNEMEAQLKRVYPGFCSQLRTLYAMSELEYQVCLLIKLRIAPTDMAAVLLRDASTISTVRSRLYKKVFGRKGGSKEWDEFILSMGA